MEKFGAFESKYWVQILDPVSLGKPLNLLDPQFVFCKLEKMILTSEGCHEQLSRYYAKAQESIEEIIMKIEIGQAMC